MTASSYDSILPTAFFNHFDHISSESDTWLAISQIYNQSIFLPRLFPTKKIDLPQDWPHYTVETSPYRNPILSFYCVKDRSLIKISFSCFWIDILSLRMRFGHADSSVIDGKYVINIIINKAMRSWGGYLGSMFCETLDRCVLRIIVIATISLHDQVCIACKYNTRYWELP